MIHLEVIGTKCRIPERGEWDKVTIDQAVELMEHIEMLPAELKELYRLFTEEQTPEVKKKAKEIEGAFTIEQLRKEFPMFYGKALEILSDLPREIIDLMKAEEREAIYSEYLFPFVHGLMYFPSDFKEDTRDHFIFEGVEYQYPRTRTVGGKLVDGKVEGGLEMPLFSSTAIEFTEAADLQVAADKMSAGRYEMAKHIVAVLCRPDGEKYDEKVATERAQKMGTLKMSTVWQVFFCLVTSSKLSEQRSQISYLVGQLLTSQIEQRKLADLTGMDGSQE